MPLTARMTLILMLMLPTGGPVLAQETTAIDPAVTGQSAPTTDEITRGEDASQQPATEETPAGEAAAVPRERDSREIRNEFSAVLRQHPYELSRVLVLEPGLMTNSEYMEGYPRVQRYLEANPEVTRNPRFYLAEFRTEPTTSGGLDDMLEGLLIFAVFAFIAFVLGWIIRTIIEQKRWNRLSKAQAEVHNKILDRFGSSDEVLNYIKTPAGSKFLESAPIPVRAERPATATPMTRIMWSIQLGVIVAAGSLGMLLVGLRFSGEGAQGLFALGAIGFCVGAGFIGSAYASLMLSRRLGIWQDPGPDAEISSDGPGMVR